MPLALNQPNKGKKPDWIFGIPGNSMEMEELQCNGIYQSFEFVGRMLGSGKAGATSR